MVTTFTDVAAFNTAFAQQVATNEKFIGLFFAGIDDRTGLPWCPDCIFATPYVDRVVNEAVENGRNVLKGTVTHQEWKGWSEGKNHPYRKDPYDASGVPTMILFQGED